MVEQCRPYLAFDYFTNATLATYLQRVVEDDAEQSLRTKEAPSTGMVGKAVAAITEDLNTTTKWLGSFFSPPIQRESIVQGEDGPDILLQRERSPTCRARSLDLIPQSG